MRATESPPAARLYRGAALVECADAATLAELMAGPLGRYVVRRLSDTVAVVDHAHFEAIVEALLAGGLLLLESAPRAAAGTAIVDLADRASPLRWVWAPQAVLDALPSEELDRFRLIVARRAPERVEAGSFADFRRDVYLIIRFLKGSGLRLTRTGQPHRTDQRKLLAALRPGQVPVGRRAVGVEVDGRLAFLLQLLMQTGLARDAGAVLRAAESADAFLDAPELLAAKQLYDAWLRLDWNEFARLAHVSIERSPYAVPSDAPTRERLAGARRAIGELLAGLAGAEV